MKVRPRTRSARVRSIPAAHTLELIQLGLGGENVFEPTLNLVVLTVYVVAFLLAGMRFHVVN